MKIPYRICIILILGLFNLANAQPKIYLFVGGDEIEKNQTFFNHDFIQGVQKIYSWKKLEPKKDQYDFSQIESDLKLLHLKNKSLFIQIQDKSFSPNIIPVPDYLKIEKYAGGVEEQIDFAGDAKHKTAGWVTKQWNPEVRARFQQLLNALGKQFDGRISGINLPETSIDLTNKQMTKTFCDNYFNSVIDNMRTLKKAFPKSIAMQYVNFFPCEWNNDHHYMSRLFEFAIQNKIALGNPDGVPFRRGQMQNSYPFFHQYQNQISNIGVAIQEPDYIYRNPKTKKLFTVEDLFSFSKNYLGASIIFWNNQEPQFSKQAVPFMKKI